jgi:hypothetical protein
MKTRGSINRYVDFTVVEIEEGGASIEHFRREDIVAAFDREGWKNDRRKLLDWLHSSEPGDMFAFQSGWIFRRIPK